LDTTVPGCQYDTRRIPSGWPGFSKPMGVMPWERMSTALNWCSNNNLHDPQTNAEQKSYSYSGPPGPAQTPQSQSHPRGGRLRGPAGAVRCCCGGCLELDLVIGAPAPGKPNRLGILLEQVEDGQAGGGHRRDHILERHPTARRGHARSAVGVNVDLPGCNEPRTYCVVPAGAVRKQSRTPPRTIRQEDRSPGGRGLTAKSTLLARTLIAYGRDLPGNHCSRLGVSTNAPERCSISSTT